MVESFANKITSFLVYSKAIEDQEYNLYLYGFKTLIAFVINIVVILFVGSMINRFKETLLFLLCYCPIRQFTGGYHADSYKKCLISFILIYLANIFIVERLAHNNLEYFIIVAMLIGYIGIYFLSPLEHRNNPLNYKERKKYRKVAIYISSIVIIFSMIGINFSEIYKYSIYAASSIICIYVMLVLGIIKQRNWR